MKMKVFKTIAEMRRWSEEQRKNGKRIGFAPTMGYLHEGHLSLMRLARQNSDVLVVSIFINPAQFAPGEDLDKYPRDFDRDHFLCDQEAVDVIFYPEPAQMYGPDHKTYVITETHSGILCGRTRPTHFRGVTTVVAKLFNIIQPQVVVFGQKDAQQALIIRRMIGDLNFNIEMIIAPIVREPDGLAMSSRNKYLTPDERNQALCLYDSLKLARDQYAAGNHALDDILGKMKERIARQPLARIDYIEAVDADTLGPAEAGVKNTLIALAVFFGKTRLIDNTILEMKS
jgi:pantoate--beta-alanine ligase